MMQNVYRYFILLAVCFLLTSCLGSSDDAESFSIIIPPGDQVKFSTKDFLNYSDDNFTAIVRKVGGVNSSLQTLIDVTPEGLDKLIENKIHKTIVPKGSSLNGFLILEIEMDYHENHFYAFVFDSETVVTPNLYSSLTYELLANYPGRSIKTYSRDQISSIQTRIETIVKERMEFFGLDFNIRMDYLYKFFKNTLSSNYDFLTFMQNYDVDFYFDISGDVISAPYPFGEINNPPVLNEQASTNLGLRLVTETTEAQINAIALDPDGDLVFYVWTFNDEFHDSGTTQFSWVPDYSHARPETYPVSAIISDGGKIFKADWDLKVIDLNQPPLLSVDCSDLSSTENIEYVCQLSGTDPDNDDLSWELGAGGHLGTSTLNGVAPGIETTGSTAELRFTPNNGDAKKKSASFELYLKDGKGGVDVKLLQVSVSDNNVAPILLGDLEATNSDHLAPREWDYCLNKDTYGLPDDTGNNGAYTFKVVLQDPDNVAGAFPEDTIKLKLTGLGTQNIVETAQIPDPIAKTVTYHFQWKPDNNSLIANINFNITDDHGGNAGLITRSLVAKNINQRACMTFGSAATFWVRYIDGYKFKYYRYPHRGKDNDGDIPLMVRSAIDIDILPHQTDYYGSKPIVVRKRFDEIELTHKTKASTKWQGNRTYSKARYAGLLKFTRASEGSSDITVPKGFSFSTNEVSTGYLVEFETAAAVTIAPSEEEVIVPVLPINRDVPANHLSVIVDPLTDGSLVVTHSAFSGEFTYVTFTRGSGSAGLDVVIPEDTRITNAPGTTSFEYKVAGDFFMASGVPSVQVPVYFSGKKIPSGSNIIHSLGSPDLTLSLPVTMRDHINYTIHPYKGWVQKEFVIHAYDGATTKAGEITIIKGALAATTLMVTNTASFYEFGEVEFSRPLTDSTNVLNIPAGTLLAAESGNKYLTTEAINLNTSETNKIASVRRILEKSWNQHGRRERFSDYNHKPLLASSGLNITVNEGGEVINFPIEVKDGLNPFVAMDPDDRYKFTNIPQTIAPVAPVNFCRNMVSNYTDSNSSSTCTPCNVVQPGLKYHGSRICYANFKPDALDLAENYVLKIEVDDNGYNYPTGSTKSTLSITLSVLEDNEAPVLTDETGAPVTGGETISNPIVISQPFIENVPGLLKVHATDGDKTFELKKIGLEILNVYDVSQGNLNVDIPEGLEITILEQNYDESGVGSLTSAGVKWLPTDADIKKYTGAGGLIVKLKIFDNIFKPTESLSIERFFKIELTNKNNIPGFYGLEDTLTPYIDTYFTKTITVVDSDEATPLFGTFQTSLTLCKDKFGNALPHPTLDDPLDTDPVDCHAHSSQWGAKFTQYSSDYEGNLDVPECRIGSGVSSTLNADLAVPKFTRVAGPYTSNGKIAYDYKIEWCPQSGQIDEFGIGLVLNDNGDEDRQNMVLDPKVGSVSLQVNVISPVFFQSPKLSLQEVPDSDPAEYAMLPEHFMVQTTTRGGNDKFYYPLLISNSKKNPIDVTVLESPRDCALENGVCIEKGDGLEDYTLVWQPKYADDVTVSNDPSTWHKIKLKVRDQVTEEEDIVYFYLQVNLPSTNLNYPIINSKAPTATNLTINELETLAMSVSVTDRDSSSPQVLHYSWYVDGKLVHDEGATYDYIPNKIQGGIDVDGEGPLKKGEHEVKVIVSDGNFKAAQEWTVQVRNTYLVPEKVFDLVEQRKEVDNVTVTDVSVSLELPFEETVYGGGGEEYYFNHVLFSGSYKNGVVKKNFLWDLKFYEGKIKKENFGSPWSLYEDLPWSSENKTEQLSYYYVGSQLGLLASSKPARAGPYVTTQDAVKLTGNLSSISTPLAGGFKCVGTCARNLYLGDKAYGNRLSQRWGNYLFWVDDSSKELKFDFNESNLLSVADFFNFDGDGDDIIYGLNINDGLKRLYVSTQDNSSGKSYIHIYDLSPLGTSTDDSGSAVPSLIGSLDISLPAPYAALEPGVTEIVVDEVSDKVYSFLSGVGGVLYFTDSGVGLPSLSASSYLGLDDISASPTDLPSTGRKLVYNEVSTLLLGVSREGNQIFTVNTGDSNKVSVHSYPQRFNAIMSYIQTGLSLVISREQGMIFELK